MACLTAYPFFFLSDFQKKVLSYETFSMFLLCPQRL